MLKYRYAYIFQTKIYTEAILSNSTRKLVWLSLLSLLTNTPLKLRPYGAIQICLLRRSAANASSVTSTAAVEADAVSVYVCIESLALI